MSWLMILLCAAVITGMWLEHYLLLGPALGGGQMRLSVGDVMIFLGFAGLLAACVSGYLGQFPGLLEPGAEAAAKSGELD